MENSHDQLPDQAENVARMIEEAGSIVFFTGAGISTESGIADFRSPGGVWSRMRPIPFEEFLASEEIRLEDWRRRFHFQAQFEQAPVNAGHKAVAALFENGQGKCLITQNIDGLHLRSGVDPQQIIELHGNGTSASCLDCRSPMTLQQAAEIIRDTGKSPRCVRCNGLVKSDVVSFGQQMPRIKMLEAAEHVRLCDLCIVLGSSLVVQPAARLPEIARQSGAKLLIINRESTPLDAIANRVVRVPIGILLQKALEKIGIGNSAT